MPLIGVQERGGKRIGQKQLFDDVITEIFPELIKYIKPKIHKQSTKRKEKILKVARKKTYYLKKSDFHTSQYQ